jgi:hypothetical protein
MSAAFQSIHVQPAYGARQALVSWRVTLPDKAAADVFIYRSETGLPGSWKILNDTTPIPAHIGGFVDDNLVAEKSTAPFYYRAAMRLSATEIIDSPVTSTFDTLSRRDFTLMTNILRHQLRRMDLEKALRVLLYIPRPNGSYQANINPVTGQQISGPSEAALADTGAPFGFYQPIKTFVALTGSMRRAQEKFPEGGGSMVTRVAARFLAYPMPAPGQVIVQPNTDTRYVIDTDLQINAFRGMAPVYCTGSLELLPKTDWRYKLPTNPNVSLFW